jgi:hypothetical protein
MELGLRCRQGFSFDLSTRAWKDVPNASQWLPGQRHKGLVLQRQEQESESGRRGDGGVSWDYL